MLKLYTYIHLLTHYLMIIYFHHKFVKKVAFKFVIIYSVFPIKSENFKLLIFFIKIYIQCNLENQTFRNSALKSSSLTPLFLHFQLTTERTIAIDQNLKQCISGQ